MVMMLNKINLLVSLMMILTSFSFLSASTTGNSSTKDSSKQCGLSIGIPGIPGTPGTPGSPGIPGSPGQYGSPGRDGIQGDKGPVGPKGENGIPGKDGVPGKDGGPGKYGLPGNNGLPGKDGIKGDPGSPGVECGLNWKQCAWQKSEGKDIGLIKECVFKKNSNISALHVSYQGNIHVYDNLACKRWYFRFNGAECKDPAPIDAAMWSRSTTGAPEHRHASIEGYCENIHKGHVRVSIWIGNCPGHGDSDGHTGWISYSRIMIREVPQPQQ